jgi:hypothetical protein
MNPLQTFTREYCLPRLLEHGPMTPEEIAYCAVWPLGEVLELIDTCVRKKQIRRICHLGHYRFTAIKNDLRNLQALATQSKPSNGASPHGAVRAGASLDVPAASAHMREAQARSAANSGSAAGMAGEGVSA